MKNGMLIDIQQNREFKTYFCFDEASRSAGTSNSDAVTTNTKQDPLMAPLIPEEAKNLCQTIFGQLTIYFFISICIRAHHDLRPWILQQNRTITNKSKPIQAPNHHPTDPTKSPSQASKQNQTDPRNHHQPRNQKPT